MTEPTASERQADVIVVGAGPGGSTAAGYLARAGVDVLLLEKSAFPREKVCGDGLTPRAVRQLIRMGIDIDDAGWVRNRGLRIIGGGNRLEIPWPDLAEYPSYGLVRTRLDFDQILAQHAQKLGARLQERTAVTGPVIDEASGQIVGVTARPVDESGHKSGDEQTFRAPIVIAADGSSSRLGLAMGLPKRDNRPLGVAVRTYYTSPRHDDDWLESWLELWDGEPGDLTLLPGYGWIFGVGDGTSNVGLGILNTTPAFQHVDYRDLLLRWLDHTPEEWGFREENRTQPVHGAALPMGFNRKPHYANGMLLVGDSGGMVNPFNGEGIAYAMEAGEMAADVITQALSRTTATGRERALAGYVDALDARYGGYYTLGRVFVAAIGNPHVMQLATRHGLPRPTLMRFTLKLLANLTDPRDGDAMDRLINGLSKVAPAA
ncbi:MAG: menaquinone-9 beta-reductase [Nocardioidaceae bacterium]|jgi:geranylgeranyl reductase family protein|nr:menaquinone-9 beta-reductase [Nocardioidaceae bacterium]